MARKFISSIVMAAVAATSISVSASPAQAGNDDLAKFLVGATALIIIGSALSADNTHQAAPVHVKPVQPPKPVKPNKPRRKALTAACVRRHQLHSGKKTKIFGRKCLQSHYRHFSSLPKECAVRVSTVKGARRGFSIPCLKHNGYYIVASK